MSAPARDRRFRRAAACAALLALAACHGGGKDAAPPAAAKGAPQGRLRWTAETRGGIDSTPAVAADGTIYVWGGVAATEDDKGQPLPAGRVRLALMAVDASGHITRTLPGSLQTGFPPRRLWVSLASGGTAYGVDDAGGLYIMAGDGTQSFHVTGDFLHGPAAISDSGRLFCDANRGMVAIDPGDPSGPRIVSKSEDGGFNQAVAVGPDGTVYVGTSGGVAAIDAAGERRWLARARASTPVVDGQGRIYFSDRNRLVALHVAGGERWHYEAADALTIPALSPEGVIVVGAAGLLQVFSHDGEKRWSFPLATQSWTPPTAGPDGTVYVTDRGALLTAVAPGGQVRWSLKLPVAGSSAGVGPDGTVYVQGGDGRLRAVGPP